MAWIDRHSAGAEDVSADTLLARMTQAARETRARLDTAVADLFLPDGPRLTDLERATMTQLLAKLVAATEDDLRQRLLGALDDRAPPELTASLAAGRLAIAAPILESAGLLRDAELVALLLRRTEEHRLVTALHLTALSEHEAERSSEQGLLDALLQRDEAELAASVMALLIAESRRFDRFQDPLLARTDLPAEIQHRLTWWVAAALRNYMVERQRLDPAIADRAIVASANGALTAYDEGETLEGRALDVARHLARLGLLDDALLLRALREGTVALVAAGLAVRAGIDFSAAWDMVTDPEGGPLTVLLRAIDMPRPLAAEMLLRLAVVDRQPGAEEGVAARMDAYDQLDADRARAAIAPWRLDGAYRRAIEDIAAGRVRGR